MAQALLSISPEIAIIDDAIVVKLEGVEPGAPVTIDCFLHYFGHMHLAFAHFYARSDGTVVPSEQSSFGGSYTGKLDMGLFTAMEPLPSIKEGGRLIVKGHAAEVLEFTLTAWKGHKTRDELHFYHCFQTSWSNPITSTNPSPSRLRSDFLSSAISKRTYLHPDVVRQEIVIDHGDTPIRGILFKPKGPGPFPGIVDLFGGAQGCLEFRSALLAKAGFASFACAYIGYKDLPYKG